MRTFVAAGLSAAFAALASLPAEAAGCVSGAAVGGAAGHVAGHHGVLGAAAGCAVGHHEANKAKAQKAAQTPPASGANGNTGGGDTSKAQ